MRMHRRFAVSFFLALLAVCMVFPAAQIQAMVLSPEDKLTFEVYQDARKEYRWRLKSSNGKVLATPGQGFTTKKSCEDSVERFKTNAGDKYKFDVYQDNKKEYRWRAVASNGQTIASCSEGYKNKGDCEKTVEMIKKEAKNAMVAEGN